MLNVCHRCGIYRADKIIDPTGPYAVCPECGFQHPFKYLPLLVVSGASGTGKSTVCNYLTGRCQGVLPIDSDILWRHEFDTPGDNYRSFFETWLRMCKNIHQSGIPVVLFGAGAGVPGNLENCIERRYFSEIHYLALVCSGEILRQRLLQRPSWRGCSDPIFMEKHQDFNLWFIEYDHAKTQPPITILDTGSRSIDETAHQVAAWIHQHQKKYIKERRTQ